MIWMAMYRNLANLNKEKTVGPKKSLNMLVMHSDLQF